MSTTTTRPVARPCHQSEHRHHGAPRPHSRPIPIPEVRLCITFHKLKLENHADRPPRAVGLPIRAGRLPSPAAPWSTGSRPSGTATPAIPLD
jgi:hypothetical protein